MTASSVIANDNLKFGDVVLVRFPFTNQLTTKQRPAIVVSGSTYNQKRSDVLVLAITSQLSHVGEYAHYEFVDWETAGLLKASLIKPIMATIEQGLIVQCLGQATNTDLSGLERVLNDIRTEALDLPANA